MDRANNHIDIDQNSTLKIELKYHCGDRESSEQATTTKNLYEHSKIPKAPTDVKFHDSSSSIVTEVHQQQRRSGHEEDRDSGFVVARSNHEGMISRPQNVLHEQLADALASKDVSQAEQRMDTQASDDKHDQELAYSVAANQITSDTEVTDAGSGCLELNTADSPCQLQDYQHQLMLLESLSRKRLPRIKRPK